MEQEKLLENAGRHINCKNHLGKDFGIIYSPENVHIYDLAILFRGIHSKKKKRQCTCIHQEYSYHYYSEEPKKSVNRLDKWLYIHIIEY